MSFAINQPNRVVELTKPANAASLGAASPHLQNLPLPPPTPRLLLPPPAHLSEIGPEHCDGKLKRKGAMSEATALLTSAQSASDKKRVLALAVAAGDAVTTEIQSQAAAESDRRERSLTGLTRIELCSILKHLGDHPAAGPNKDTNVRALCEKSGLDRARVLRALGALFDMDAWDQTARFRRNSDKNGRGGGAHRRGERRSTRGGVSDEGDGTASSAAAGREAGGGSGAAAATTTAAAAAAATATATGAAARSTGAASAPANSSRQSSRKRKRGGLSLAPRGRQGSPSELAGSGREEKGESDDGDDEEEEGDDEDEEEDSDSDGDSDDDDDDDDNGGGGKSRKPKKRKTTTSQKKSKTKTKTTTTKKKKKKKKSKANDVPELQWAILWPWLREKGWGFVAGDLAHPYFYLVPGAKKRKGVLGVTMFAGEEAVMDYVRAHGLQAVADADRFRRIVKQSLEGGGKAAAAEAAAAAAAAGEEEGDSSGSSADENKNTKSNKGGGQRTRRRSRRPRSGSGGAAEVGGGRSRRKRGARSRGGGNKGGVATR